MKISVGVRIGIDKVACDDTAFIGNNIINNTDFVTEVQFPVLVGVADGVGGTAGGKEASLFIADEMCKVDFLNSDEEQLDCFVKEINKRLITYANNTPGKESMASTLTALWLNDAGNSFLIHVGNTRAYQKRGSYLKQLTDDQTTYQWLLNRGQYESAEKCNKNEILSCMGGNDELLIGQLVVRKIFKDGIPKSIVLTSDGIHEYVDIDDLEDNINSNKEDLVIIHDLMDCAEKNDSKDDKSVLIVRQ